jgi:aspartate kinase
MTMPLILQPIQWIVQKYGGTSLGKLLPTITGSIIPQYLEGHKISVVCSAISGTSKTLGTTSLLLQAIDFAMDSKDRKRLDITIDTIRDQHLNMSSKLKMEIQMIEGAKNGIFESLEAGVVQDCEGLRSFLVAAQVRGTQS